LEASDLEYHIDSRPDFAFLTVKLPASRTLRVEASAMASMDSHIQMKTRARGGFGRFLTGESLFVNEFTADGGPGEICIAPGSPGDLAHYALRGDELFLQSSSFVASGMDVKVETKWQGMMRGFFSGESLFLIRCTGHGDLWFNTYGALLEIDVAGQYVVDTGHIVAFTGGLDYSVQSVGGYKSLFLSGEGLVCSFEGEGKVWIQSRQVPALASWAWPFRPKKQR
jgi:uncharacterized protein (TIGR00266 family)